MTQCQLYALEVYVIVCFHHHEANSVLDSHYAHFVAVVSRSMTGILKNYNTGVYDDNRDCMYSTYM